MDDTANDNPPTLEAMARELLMTTGALNAAAATLSGRLIAVIAVGLAQDTPAVRALLVQYLDDFHTVGEKQARALMAITKRMADDAEAANAAASGPWVQ